MATEHAHAHHAEGEVHAHIATERFYFGVLAALIILTIITVKVSYYDFGAANILIALAVATTKASLVAAFFMHLRHDKLFNTIAFLAAFLFLAIFILLTYDDLGRRDMSGTPYLRKGDPASGQLAPGGLPATSATQNAIEHGAGEHAAPPHGGGEKKE